MARIEDIETKASDLLKKMGLDWLDNRLDPDTTFKITAVDWDDVELTTALNYMLWRGWIEKVPVMNTEGGFNSAWKLTNSGQSLAISNIHGAKTKPEATPKPSEGRRCP
jgi:hypothetical protein